MSYDKLFEVLGDDRKTKSFISNFSSGALEIPYIMEETLKILSDESPFCNLISEHNKKALCIMLDLYFNDCYAQYIEDVDLAKMIKYAKIEVYSINAAEGIRYATVNEVAQGVKGLIGENTYPAGEEAYKKLCLLQWSFKGVSYYFRQAGFKLEYDDNGHVTTTFFEMVQMSAVALKELFDWMAVRENFETALKKIKKLEKSKGYKYNTYAKDEVSEDITIKQLINDICNVFTTNSAVPEYRKALALAINAKKNRKILTPLEISQLRAIYEDFAKSNKNSLQTLNEGDSELREKCELLLAKRTSGEINPNHFAYTIIATLRKNNYSKCSPKQYSILEDAFKILKIEYKGKEGSNPQEVQGTPVISDDEIESSLGSMLMSASSIFDDPE